MNPKAIHETIISTIINGMEKPTAYVKDAIDAADKSRMNKTRSTNVARSSSIARASSGLTFTYPTLCSTSLDISDCMLVGRALERRNVTMLQMLLAANQWTKENIMDYLKNFHTNLNYNKVDIDDILGMLNDDLPKIAECKTDPNLMNLMPLKEKQEAISDFRNNTNYFFNESVNESSISRFVSLDVNGYKTVLEAGNGKNPDPKQGKNQKGKPDPKAGSKTDPKANKPKHDPNKPVDPGVPAKKPDPKKPEPDVKEPTPDKDMMGYDQGIPNYDGENKLKNKIIDYGVTDRLVSSEVKKANEMVPSLMLVNTIDPSTGVNMQCVIGVKSRIVAVPSNEIVGRILSNYEDSNVLLKFVKLTTREISFFKDFLFAVDRAKLDAINNSKKGSSSSLFKALERRSQGGRVRRLAKTDKNMEKAIAALVVSQDDVEELKKDYNIDVEIPRIIIPIMEKLSLLYFVIVDQSSQSVKILIDGSDDYEIYTYDALNKESKDDSYKKVINLMTKMTN